MDRSPTSRRTRKPPQPKQSDLYSTVVVHDNENSPRNDGREGRKQEQNSDIYATMLYKDDVHVDENDDESLPPLLKRLPKDFGGEPTINSDDDEESDGASISGTVIVKTSRNSKPRSGGGWDPSEKKGSLRRNETVNARSYRRRFEESEEEEDEEVNFSTFVVRDREEDEDEEEEMGSGTVVRKTRRKSAGGGSGTGTMSRAVASMQAAGEFGAFGKPRKSGGGGRMEDSSGNNGDRRMRAHSSGKVSMSSIPDIVTKEDPSVKYELLHELGKIFSKSSIFV